MEVWMLNIILDKSQWNCGQIQSLKRVLPLLMHQLPHCEALWVTHSASNRVPLIVSGFPKPIRCPTAPCVVKTRQKRCSCIASDHSVHHFCIRRCSCFIYATFKAIHHLETFAIHLWANFTFAMLFQMTKLRILLCSPLFCWNMADKMRACRDAPKVCRFVLKGHASRTRFPKKPLDVFDGWHCSSFSLFLLCWKRMLTFVNFCGLSWSFFATSNRFWSFSGISADKTHWKM